MKTRAPKDGPGGSYPYAATDGPADIVRNWVTADGKNAPDDVVHYFKEWHNETIAEAIVRGWNLPRILYGPLCGACQLYRINTLKLPPQ